MEQYRKNQKLSNGHILIKKLAPNFLSGPECTPFTKAMKKCISKEIPTLLKISVVAFFYKLELVAGSTIMELGIQCH